MWDPHHEWHPLPLFRREGYVGGEEVGCQGHGVCQGGALQGEENVKLKLTVSQSKIKIKIKIKVRISLLRRPKLKIFLAKLYFLQNISLCFNNEENFGLSLNKNILIGA